MPMSKGSRKRKSIEIEESPSPQESRSPSPDAPNKRLHRQPKTFPGFQEEAIILLVRSGRYQHITFLLADEDDVRSLKFNIQKHPDPNADRAKSKQIHNKKTHIIKEQDVFNKPCAATKTALSGPAAGHFQINKECIKNKGGRVEWKISMMPKGEAVTQPESDDIVRQLEQCYIVDITDQSGARYARIHAHIISHHPQTPPPKRRKSKDDSAEVANATFSNKIILDCTKPSQATTTCMPPMYEDHIEYTPNYNINTFLQAHAQPIFPPTNCNFDNFNTLPYQEMTSLPMSLPMPTFPPMIPAVIPFMQHEVILELAENGISNWLA